MNTKKKTKTSWSDLKATTVSLWSKVFSRAQSANTDNSVPPGVVKTDEIKRVGIILAPLEWQVFRIASSVTAALLGVLVLWNVVTLCLLLFTNWTQGLPWWLWFGVTSALTAQFARPDVSTGFRVPEKNFLAMLTWLGIPLRIYLETGKYGSWTGQRLGLGRLEAVRAEFTTPTEDPKENAFGDGFLKGGDVAFPVWNQANSKAENRKVIKAPAKNRAEISATLTLFLTVVDPFKLLDSDDPALDIGERARQEFREMVNQFVDTDVQSLQQVTADVLMGTELITVFLPKPIAGQKAGAMIRDSGGKAMFALLNGATEEENTKITSDFIADVLARGEEEVLKTLTIGEEANRELKKKLDRVKVEKPLNEVLQQLGLVLKRATFGDIILSQPVTDAANKASSENDERIAELADAETKKVVRQTLLPSAEELGNPAWEAAMMIAEAKNQGKDSPIKIIHVTGGDPLTKAGVAAASQIGGEK